MLKKFRRKLQHHFPKKNFLDSARPGTKNSTNGDPRTSTKAIKLLCKVTVNTSVKIT
jgi:hypothetical protein